jgi:hypothetical protein
LKTTSTPAARHRTRIALEVGRLIELGGIHEDGRDHEVGAAARVGAERQVSGVEGSHRGHQRNSASGPALRIRPRLKLDDFRDHAHGDYR